MEVVMRVSFCRLVLTVTTAAVASCALCPGAADRAAPVLRFAEAPGKITITVNDDREPLAAYVSRDEQTPRPYFSYVHAPGGVMVTRPQPPVEGRDPTD